MNFAASDRPQHGQGGAAHRFAHDAMACTFELYLVGVGARYARQAAEAAFEEVDRLEQLLSRFIPHSDIGQINALQPGSAIRVSPETIECLQLAAEVHQQTGGAFDIAFRSQPRIGPDGPSPLIFDPTQSAIGVQRTGVVLDLGAIGKGYAVDRVAALLREWKIPAALVHSGQSTVYALGRPPTGDAWRLTLRSPDEQGDALGTLALTDEALSGSGQRLHGGHIRDPRTGAPATAYSATWAVASSAAVSDALSTAFMLLTPAEVATVCGRQRDVSGILRPTTAQTGRELLCFGRHQPGT